MLLLYLLSTQYFLAIIFFLTPCLVLAFNNSVVLNESRKNEYNMLHRNLNRLPALGTINVDEDEEEPNGQHDEIKHVSTLDDQTAAEEELNKDTYAVISKSPQGNKFLCKIYILSGILK